MGVFDHRRHWRYDVAASPEQCLNAFARAFAGRAGLIVSAEWQISRKSNGALAVYGGRRGLGGLILNKTQELEHESAIGSEVTFEIEATNAGRTTAVMWLNSSGRAGIGGLLGVTSDARFIRPYMRRVAREILALDPTAEITTQ